MLLLGILFSRGSSIFPHVARELVATPRVASLVFRGNPAAHSRQRPAARLEVVPSGAMPAASC
jgi:hypothetical protein